MSTGKEERSIIESQSLAGQLQVPCLPIFLNNNSSKHLWTAAWVYFKHWHKLNCSKFLPKKCDSLNANALMLFFASKCYKIVFYFVPCISEYVNYLKVQQYKGTSWIFFNFSDLDISWVEIGQAEVFTFQRVGHKDLFNKDTFSGMQIIMSSNLVVGQ